MFTDTLQLYISPFCFTGWGVVFTVGVGDGVGDGEGVAEGVIVTVTSVVFKYFSMMYAVLPFA